MMKAMMAGMFVDITLNVDGRIIKTNAPFVKGSDVTLLQLDFDKLLADEAALQKLQGATDMKALASVPGLKVIPWKKSDDRVREVTIATRDAATQAPDASARVVASYLTLAAIRPGDGDASRCPAGHPANSPADPAAFACPSETGGTGTLSACSVMCFTPLFSAGPKSQNESRRPVWWKKCAINSRTTD